MKVFITALLRSGGQLMMSGRSSLVFILLSAAGILSLSVSSSKCFEVVVFGSTAIDFVAYTNVLPQKGETVFGSSFAKNFGGKGANQAVQCARLGIDVSMCGSVGDDSLGEEYIRQFQSEGVSIDFITKSKGVSTGIANINVETSTGANTIVVVAGANANVDISLDNVGNQALVEHIRQARVLICQNEVPLASTLTALNIARSGNTLSIFNPAPASLDLIDLVGACDIICPNETELSTLTCLPTKTEEEIVTAADHLLSLGCNAVIVTLGERGAYLASRARSLFIRTEPVVAVDSTGAGDSFIGTLASNIARGCSIENAVRNALYCATISVQSSGAQKSYARLSNIPENFRPPEYSELKHDKLLLRMKKAK